MKANFRPGIIAVDFKGSHINIEFLLSATGIQAVYPIIAISMAHKIHPIISLKETVVDASILRMTIPIDVVETNLLNELTTK